MLKQMGLAFFQMMQIQEFDSPRILLYIASKHRKTISHTHYLTHIRGKHLYACFGKKPVYTLDFIKVFAERAVKYGAEIACFGILFHAVVVGLTYLRPHAALSETFCGQVISEPGGVSPMVLTLEVS